MTTVPTDLSLPYLQLGSLTAHHKMTTHNFYYCMLHARVGTMILHEWYKFRSPQTLTVLQETDL